MRHVSWVLLLLLGASPVSADHIGIYADATGTSCVLAGGLTSTATIIHTSSEGSIGSQFQVGVANAPGSVVLAISSPFQAVCINPPCPFLYGGCAQSVVVGTLIALLEPGYIEVVSALSMGCNETENPTTGGRAYIGGTGDCSPLAAEPSTWGRVKALYR